MNSGGLLPAAGGLLGVGGPAEAVGGAVEAALQLHRGHHKLKFERSRSLEESESPARVVNLWVRKRTAWSSRFEAQPLGAQKQP